MQIHKQTLRRVLFGLVIGLSPSLAHAGPICDGFWDCLPYTILVVVAFAIQYGSPVVFTITVAALLYSRFRKKTLSAGWRGVLITFLLLSSIGLVYLAYFYASDLLATRRYNLDSIGEIQRDDLQIYKTGHLRRPYVMGRYSGCFNCDIRRFNCRTRGVRVEIAKGEDAYWATMDQHLAVQPGTSPDCTDHILGGTDCPLFGATPGGVPVYILRTTPPGNPWLLMVSKGTTAITLTVGQVVSGFSDAELAYVYEMIDSLTPVTLDELRHYHRHLLDNLN
jgi:hypothetical protein